MKFLNNFINPIQHPEEILILFCETLEINITRSTLQKRLLEHPDYPSLLSICDTLKYYDIDNIVVPVPLDKFEQLPRPFIAVTKGENSLNDYLTLVYETGDLIKIYNPEKSKPENLPAAKFEMLYKGLVLLANPKDSSGEKDYRLNRHAERKQAFRNSLAVFSIPGLLLVQLLVSFYIPGLQKPLSPVFFTTLTLLGCIAATLLLWHDIDENYKPVKKLCSITEQTDCSSILHSKASRIFGISWSLLGLTYFLGGLLSVLAQGIFNPSMLYLLSWMNILSLPYIIFSIYYQWRVVKKWCILCLTIQAILFSQFITSLLGRFLFMPASGKIDYPCYFTLATQYTFAFIILLLITSLAKRLKLNADKVYLLLRFKNNHALFESVLKNQKKIEIVQPDLGIALGNKDAQHHLVVVSNPACHACSTTHPLLINLLTTRNIRIRIIFSVPPADNNAQVIQHFLYLHKTEDEESLIRALNDWFSHARISHDLNVRKIPAADQHLNYQKQIENMNDWCKDMQITSTPSYFFDGFELPAYYTLSDIKYFLTV